VADIQETDSARTNTACAWRPRTKFVNTVGGSDTVVDAHPLNVRRNQRAASVQTVPEDRTDRTVVEECALLTIWMSFDTTVQPYHVDPKSKLFHSPVTSDWKDSNEGLGISPTGFVGHVSAAQD
jgi:hypothetical protein